MLLGLNLKNFAIVDDISINFSKGLNIITGETGAGKSIILNSINFILGDRFSSDIIKSGKEETQVEALFDISGNDVLVDRLALLGIESNGEELLIKRTLSLKGKGRVYINGSLVTISMLETITEGLVDIFSQNEHQTLLKEDSHLRILNEFSRLNELTIEFSTIYQRHADIKKTLELFMRDKNELLQKEDFLRYQCKEIDASGLKPAEYETLELEKRRLDHAETLFSVTKGSYEDLYEGEGSVFEVLKRVRNQIEQASRIDENLGGVVNTLERGISELQEAAFNLRDYCSEFRHDPDRLNQIEERLQELRRIQRKYGGTIEEVIEKRKKMREDLDALTNYEDKENDLSTEIKVLEKDMELKSTELSQKRHKASELFTKEVERGLDEVGLKKAKIKIEFERKEISSTGYDKVTFLFSANPDEKPRPLSKVVSGGELSRLMLILKEVISRVEGGSILIFDEAESGIGGAVAETVGRKIENLSKKYQVLCITHLPQVAKFATTHFKVSKRFDKNVTKVDVKTLNREEGVKELARMLGGIRVTEKTIEAAREMIKEE
ncbi:MAG: DNA repair protein RecN [Thermodesulfobacteriota bacterium]